MPKIDGYGLDSNRIDGAGGEYGTAGPAQVLTGFTVGTEDGVKSGTAIADRFTNMVKQEGSWTNPRTDGTNSAGASYDISALITTIPCSKLPSFIMITTDGTQFNSQPTRGWKLKYLVPTITFTINIDTLLTAAGRTVQPVTVSLGGSSDIISTSPDTFMGSSASANGLVDLSISADGKSIDVKSGSSSTYMFGLKWAVFTTN
ncbi:hypothetical protein [Paenibacillus sp. SN-8-1]|uniref:hypothetical protein n=1 Tax=Paenibacillus sp. SN-8-1 TaxID=3435409 RepID=UPI003D9A8241